MMSIFHFRILHLIKHRALSAFQVFSITLVFYLLHRIMNNFEAREPPPLQEPVVNCISSKI